MYIIKYDQNEIYAGTWKNLDGSYLYSSNSINRKNPKVFKTFKGAENHLNGLLNKIPYPNESNLRIEEWSDDDLKKHLISIGIDPIKEQILKQINKKEKYWQEIFKPIKGEIEVTKVVVNGNVCTISYLMPYSCYEYEFFFQADLDKEIVIVTFRDAVIETGVSMCQHIKECTNDVIELFDTTL